MTSSRIESARRRPQHLAHSRVEALAIGAARREEVVRASFPVPPGDVVTHRRRGDTALTPEVLPTR